MRPRLCGAERSPTTFAKKEKTPPPLPNEVTNGSDAAAMIYRMDPGSNGAPRARIGTSSARPKQARFVRKPCGRKSRFASCTLSTREDAQISQASCAANEQDFLHRHQR